MIRRWFILGILSFVMVSLLWNFYREVVVYNPIEDIEKTELIRKDKIRTRTAFRHAWGKEIVEKNPFSRLRKHSVTTLQEPVVGTEEPQPVKEPKRLVLKLSGIILNQFGEYVAYIQKGREAARPLRKGDVFDGILVVDIQQRAVELLWNGQEIRLSMEKMKKH